MFKSLQIYRLFPRMAASAFAEALAHQSFGELGNSELMRSGWIAPRGADLVHVANGQWLLNLRTDKRLLPSKVVNEVAKQRAAELEEQQGFYPGKKAMKELKERVHDELLPRAFVTAAVTQVWIDPVNGWLVIDGTASRADDVLKLLLKAIDRLPVESLRVQRSPVAVMTGWLQDDEAPSGFTIDQDATMRATGESKAQVTYKRHTLEPDAMRQHIAAGKQCVKLAMTWDSKISFVLTESLDVKSIKILDVLKENAEAGKNADERFDGDFAMVTGELAKLLADLVAALGGEFKKQKQHNHTENHMNMAEIKQFETKDYFLKQNLRDGELYAGIILGKNGEPDYHLILLPGQATDINWSDAKKFAEKAGGELPTLREGALLFANLPEQFEKRYYWTSEQHAGLPDYAWLQDFSDGSQCTDHKSYSNRARAVRRLIIQ